jgi:hypothetical protein
MFTPKNGLDFYAGIAAAMAEPAGGDLGFHFAWLTGADWLLPASLPMKVSLDVRWASGRVNDTVGSFTPISFIQQGSIFAPRFSSLMRIRGDYTVHLIESLSLDVQGLVFLKTDQETYPADEYAINSSTYLLGEEFYASLLWVPVSDVSAVLGGGAFIPNRGKTFADDAPIRWQVSLSLTLSL